LTPVDSTGRSEGGTVIEPTRPLAPTGGRAARGHIARRGLLALAAAAIAITAALVVAPPAQAQRGGGCTPHFAVTSCIPYHAVGSGELRPDFYLNVPPDSSRCWGRMEIVTTNIGTTWSPYYRLNRTGRFGPLTVPVGTLPPSSGSAINRVHIYTCSWVAHGIYTSPRIYYP
jgi:hypothetical protein